jgi:ribonuclease HII
MPTTTAPDTRHEQELYAAGCCRIAGIDEAGRGCWAGPVVAAAVVFSLETLRCSELLQHLNDSKVLSAARREASFAHIERSAEGIGVGIVPAYVIDGVGIVPATRLAMLVALLSLACRVDALLIDALPLPLTSLPQRVLIKGDACSSSIAAASIIAKVTRDRLMRTADQAYPAYGFAAHKGYGTAAHRRALHLHGPCALHRMTFRPVLLSTGL